jgi:hypothetical protein
MVYVELAQRRSITTVFKLAGAAVVSDQIMTRAQGKQGILGYCGVRE